MRNKKILSIGSYNVGLTLKTERMPAWGETIVGNNFYQTYGGKGSNQAVAARKLGGEVTFVGCLGKDNFGEDGLDMLKSLDIETKYIKRSVEKSTGVGVVILNTDNDNAIILDLGANMELLPKDITNIEDVIKETDILIVQMEIPFETTKKAMELANKYNKKVIFNPAPANQQAKELLPYATIANPNESELLLLNDMDTNIELSEKDSIELANKLLKEGPEVIIVTRGSEDTIVVTEKETLQIPVLSVKPKDTTGAGDTFTGALAVALSEEKTLKEAVKFANVAASYSVTNDGVVSAIPSRDELNTYIKKTEISIN